MDYADVLLRFSFGAWPLHWLSVSPSSLAVGCFLSSVPSLCLACVVWTHVSLTSRSSELQAASCCDSLCLLGAPLVPSLELSAVSLLPGDDWSSLFDINVVNGRKPAFFTAKNPFYGPPYSASPLRLCIAVSCR